MKGIFFVVFFCMSFVAHAFDKDTQIERFVKEIAIELEVSGLIAKDVTFAVKGDELNNALNLVTQGMQSPLVMNKIKGIDGQCVIAYNKSVSSVVWEDVEMLEFAVVHEAMHCADFQFFNMNGRNTILHAEEMADLSAMFYFKKKYTTEKAQAIIEKMIAFRQEMDDDHSTLPVLLKHSHTQVRVDYVNQANDLIEHSLFDKIVELF